MKNYNRNRNNNWKYNNDNRHRQKRDERKPEGLQVFVREGEDINKALRKLKKKVEAAGILKETRDRQFYTKPSEKRRKAKQAGRMRWLKKQREMERN